MQTLGTKSMIAVVQGSFVLLGASLCLWAMPALAAPKPAPLAPVTLTLYVHADDRSGPMLIGAEVHGQDGSGKAFSQTTNGNGVVIITGEPGTWEFAVSRNGYKENQWNQSITGTGEKHAFLETAQQPKPAAPPPAPVAPPPPKPAKPAASPPPVAPAGPAAPAPRTSPPPAPALSGPGDAKAPGPVLSDASIAFTWTGDSGATGYGLYIRDLTTNILIYPNAQGTTAKPLTGTSLKLPATVLEPGHNYRWAMTSFNGGAEGQQGPYHFFQTADPAVRPAAESPTTAVPKAATSTPRSASSEPPPAQTPVTSKTGGGVLSVPSKEPTPAEIEQEIESLALANQIPPIILQAICYQESTWRQLGGHKNDNGTWDYGLMQVNDPKPPEQMVQSPICIDWKANLRAGVSKLLEKWSKNHEPTSSKALLEYWFFPIAWYNGEGHRAYAYVLSVYALARNGPPDSAIASLWCKVDISPVTAIAGYNADPIQEKVANYTLQQLVRGGGKVHQWNGNVGADCQYTEVTDHYATSAPPSSPSPKAVPVGGAAAPLPTQSPTTSAPPGVQPGQVTQAPTPAPAPGTIATPGTVAPSRAAAPSTPAPKQVAAAPPAISQMVAGATPRVARSGIDTLAVAQLLVNNLVTKGATDAIADKLKEGLVSEVAGAIEGTLQNLADKGVLTGTFKEYLTSDKITGYIEDQTRDAHHAFFEKLTPKDLGDFASDTIVNAIMDLAINWVHTQPMNEYQRQLLIYGIREASVAYAGATKGEYGALAAQIEVQGAVTVEIAQTAYQYYFVDKPAAAQAQARGRLSDEFLVLRDHYLLAPTEAASKDALAKLHAFAQLGGPGADLFKGANLSRYFTSLEGRRAALLAAKPKAAQPPSAQSNIAGEGPSTSTPSGVAPSPAAAAPISVQSPQPTVTPALRNDASKSKPPIPVTPTGDGPPMARAANKPAETPNIPAKQPVPEAAVASNSPSGPASVAPPRAEHALRAVAERPDFFPAGDVSVNPKEVSPGGAMTIRFLVRNQGGAAPASNTQIMIKDISTGATLCTAIVSTPAVAAKSAIEDTQTVTLPGTVRPGSARAYVTLDYDDAIGQGKATSVSRGCDLTIIVR